MWLNTKRGMRSCDLREAHFDQAGSQYRDGEQNRHYQDQGRDGRRDSLRIHEESLGTGRSHRTARLWSLQRQAAQDRHRTQSAHRSRSVDSPRQSGALQARQRAADAAVGRGQIIEFVSPQDYSAATYPAYAENGNGRGFPRALPRLHERYWLHALLFLMTLLSTTLVGSSLQADFNPNLPFDVEHYLYAFVNVWSHPGLIDRKSTRLNSSHLGISYAVFCLKKKHKQ